MTFKTITINNRPQNKRKLSEHNDIDFLFSNPPYGLKDYGFEYASKSNDIRFKDSLPKKADGEYAFILTAAHSIKESGKAFLILPLGIQFKNSTQKIRQQLIESGKIEAVIDLPPNVFFNTGIPVCLLVLSNHNKNVLMANASECFEKVLKNNQFKGEAANKIKELILNRTVSDGECELIDINVIKENDFNLSVSRYVYKEEEREEIDIVALHLESKRLYKEIEKHNKEMESLFDSIIALKKGDN